MLKTVSAGGGVSRAVRWCSGSGSGSGGDIPVDGDKDVDGGAVGGEAWKTGSSVAENVGHAMRLLTLHPAELKLTKDVEVRRMLSVRHDPAKEEAKWHMFGANASVDAAVAQQKLLRRDMEALERLASVELGPLSYAEAIRALCKRGDTHRALHYVRQMEKEGLPLEEPHASPLLNALAKRNLTEKAVAVFRKAKGCRSTRVYNALLPLFIRLYDMRAARKGSDGGGGGGGGSAAPLRKTRWLDVLFEQEGAPVPPRDTHTYYHLLRHACKGVDDVACVRRAMAEEDAALPFGSIHVQAVLIGAAGWLAVPSSPSRTRQADAVAAVGDAEQRRAIVRYAEELVEAAGDDGCGGGGGHSGAEHENQLKHVPKSPTLYSLLMTVHRNGGLAPGSSERDTAEALTKIRALFARIDLGTRLSSTYSVMLTSLACAAEIAGAAADKEALIREGEAVFAEARRSREEVLSERRVWTAAMRLYASSARPRAYKRAAEELMMQFLLSEAADDHTIRTHLAAVCGGQRKLPGFVPPKLTDRQKVRMRPRLLRRAQERVEKEGRREAARVKAAAARARAAREKQRREREEEERAKKKTRRTKQPVYSDGFEELLWLLK